MSWWLSLQATLEVEEATHSSAYFIVDFIFYAREPAAAAWVPAPSQPRDGVVPPPTSAGWGRVALAPSPFQSLANSFQPCLVPFACSLNAPMHPSSFLLNNPQHNFQIDTTAVVLSLVWLAMGRQTYPPQPGYGNNQNQYNDDRNRRNQQQGNNDMLMGAGLMALCCCCFMDPF
jgi:hypothetical protein